MMKMVHIESSRTGNVMGVNGPLKSNISQDK